MIILGTNSIKETGFNVDNSCRFDYASSDHVHKTPGSAGSGTKFVFSTWIKRTKLATAMNIIYAQTATNNYERIRFVDTDKIEISGVASGSTAYNFATDAVYRDPSAWMHLHVIRDSTQGNASNRLKVYVNGVLQALTQDTSLSQNYSGLITGANVHRIAVGNGEPLGAYLAEVILLDGQVITPDGNTGEFDDDSGIWKPLDVSGLTFGTTGFYLDFEASGNLGNDANGGDDFTEVNIDATNQSTDTCTNNFATWNPLRKHLGHTATFSEGNTIVEQGQAGQTQSVFSTMAVSTGKWYAEFQCSSNAANFAFGIARINAANSGGLDVFPSSLGGVAYFPNGNISSYQGGDANSDTGTTFVYTDIIGILFDLDNTRIYFYKNDTLVNSGGFNYSVSTDTAGSSLETTYYFAAGGNDDGTNPILQANFGGSSGFAISSGNTDGNGFGNFEFATKDGYALCTKNLAEFG